MYIAQLLLCTHTARALESAASVRAIARVRRAGARRGASRNAFATTNMELKDMPIAANHGGTKNTSARRSARARATASRLALCHVSLPIKAKT